MKAQFSPLLEMKALTDALALPLRAARHVTISQDPVDLDPDATITATKTFVVPDAQCCVIARCELFIYPEDASGNADYSHPVEWAEAGSIFELTFTRTGVQDFDDGYGARRLSGPQILVLSPGAYTIAFTDAQSASADGYKVAYRIHAYLLPETVAEELRQCETRVL